MNPEAKKKWLEALRSGRYKQGQGTLNRDNTFCCLGVLCEVLKDDLNLRVTQSANEEDLTLYDGRVAVLPEPVVRYTGITKDSHNSLIEKNDVLGWDFDAIAEWIEEHL